MLILSHSKADTQKQLNLLTEIGQILSIKYNPIKTVYMVYNKTVKISKQTFNNEIRQPALKLAGEMITYATNIKYLGYHLTDNGKFDVHIQKRKKLAIACASSLINEGFHISNSNTDTLIQLFKSFVRPIISFGLENINCSKEQLLVLRRCESNALKSMLEIPFYCKSTELIEAMKIIEIRDALDKQRMSFFYDL